ncbi:MAG TPA: XdhC family protein [Bacteroidia bacterium]|nr:XdhC family protein [Bacteroidia bacterium]
MDSLFKILEEERTKGHACALCVVVSTRGSTPLKTGAKMLLLDDGRLFGTVGGGNLEKKVIENARLALDKKESGLFQHNLLQQHGMCCGGTVEVYIESIQPPERLYIFGAGHVGRALAQYAADLSFEVFLIDERKIELNRMLNPAVNKLPLHYRQVLSSLPFDKRSFVAIMTYDHTCDREILAYCIKQPFAYLGMIGSRRKVEVTMKLLRSGLLYTEEELARVDMPMGFETGANTPEEIALSIAAKLVAVKNIGLGGRQKSGSAKRVQEIIME